MGEALSETYLSSKQAKTTAIISLFLSLAALLAAGVSAYFAFEDSKTDNAWQAEQIEILNQEVKENAEQSKKLRQLLGEILENTKHQTELQRETLTFIKSEQKNKANKLPLPLVINKSMDK
jgi:uncharacterized membrane protein YeiB